MFCQITEKGTTTSSFLLLQRAAVSDSGRYSCQPSLGSPAAASVHVIRSQYSIDTLFSDITGL